MINRKRRSQNASKVRKQAKKKKKKIAKRCEKRAQRTQHRLNMPYLYSIRENKVYISLSRKTFNKRHVAEARTLYRKTKQQIVYL